MLYHATDCSKRHNEGMMESMMTQLFEKKKRVECPKKTHTVFNCSGLCFTAESAYQRYNGCHVTNL